MVDLLLPRCTITIGDDARESIPHKYLLGRTSGVQFSLKSRMVTILITRVSSPANHLKGVVIGDVQLRENIIVL